MSNIILVETNLFFSMKLSNQLKNLGHEIHQETSIEGIKNKVGLGISAIIVNLAAKQLDPPKIIKELKLLPETSKIPVVGFCGHKESILIETAKSAGCDVVTTNAIITANLSGILESL